MDRKQYYGVLLEKRLREELERMRDEFPKHTVQSCYIDNVLPAEEALKVNAVFPGKSTMMLRKSLRENKHVAAQLN